MNSSSEITRTRPAWTDSQVLGRDDFAGWRSISRTADSPGCIEVPNLETEATVQGIDSLGRLIHENHWSRMFSNPLRRAKLIVPGKAVLSVLCEYHVVRRVRV